MDVPFTIADWTNMCGILAIAIGDSMPGKVKTIAKALGLALAVRLALREARRTDLFRESFVIC